MIAKRAIMIAFSVIIIGFAALVYAQEEEWIAMVEYNSTTMNYTIKYGPINNPVVLVYELPNKINPSVNSSIHYIGEGIYQYRYKLHNGKDSLQSLEALEIGYWQPIVSAEAPDKGWYSDTYAYKNVWVWSDTKYGRYGLPPGTSLGGFSLKAPGLPGIVNGYFQGYVKGVVFPYEPPEEIEQALKQIDSDLEKSYVTRKTIGPTAPPAVFKPLEFIDNIINLKHEAFSLGWVKNQGILQSLDAKLDNAKKKLENGDTKAAKNILSAFIDEVEAQGCPSYENCPSGKHLTSEAYGLLKYNAQYLIDKLP